MTSRMWKYGMILVNRKTLQCVVLIRKIDRKQAKATYCVQNQLLAFKDVIDPNRKVWKSDAEYRNVDLSYDGSCDKEL